MATATRREPSAGYGLFWKSGLVPLLAFAAHNIPHAHAFSSGFHRRAGAGVNIGRTSQQQNHRSFGFGPQRHKCSSFRTSSSKFFVASTTGRPLNGDNNEKKGFYGTDSEEELPWECIVDPNGCDVPYPQRTVGNGLWSKPEEDEDGSSNLKNDSCMYMISENTDERENTLSTAGAGISIT